MPSYSVITQDGRAYGPADESMLAQWAREGRLTAETLLQCHDTGQRQPAHMVPALAPHLGLSPQMVNELMRVPQPQQAMSAPAGAAAAVPVPYAQPYAYPADLAGFAPNAHGLTEFSTPAAILLHYVTFGIFSWIHFGLMHDRLPRLRQDDPSAAKAICFYLIPFFNIYWMFFEKIRICDRVNEQRRMAGLPETAPRGLAIAYCIILFIPWVNILVGWMILGPIYFGTLRASVNELVHVTRGQA